MTIKTVDEELVGTDHKRIWLEPECCSDPSTGRSWCQDPVWPTGDCPDDTPGTEYVRADLYEQLLNRVERLETALQRIRDLEGGAGYDPVQALSEIDHTARAALTGEHNG